MNEIKRTKVLKLLDEITCNSNLIKIKRLLYEKREGGYEPVIEITNANGSIFSFTIEETREIAQVLPKFIEEMEKDIFNK